MTSYIHGIGTALPDHCIAQQDAATLAAELGMAQCGERALQVLYRRSTVRQRYSVLLDSSSNGHLPSQSFFPEASRSGGRGPTTADRMVRYEADATVLAAKACDLSLRDAALAPDEITHLITISCSGFSAPGVDLGLIRDIPLSPHVERVHVGFMGCHAALNGLRVAHGLLSAHPQAKVLMCAVEICSLHHQYTDDPQQMVANSLFSDGAAALVLQSHRPDRDVSWQRIGQASLVIPETSEMMSWRIGNHGFEMSLSPQVPTIVQERLRDWLQTFLARHGLRQADVEHWGIHPGGPRILSAAAESLGLTPLQMAPSRTILETHGNMSSPTVLFILKQMEVAFERLPGHCVLLAFGPGLTIEAALLRAEHQSSRPT